MENNRSSITPADMQSDVEEIHSVQAIRDMVSRLRGRVNELWADAHSGSDAEDAPDESYEAMMLFDEAMQSDIDEIQDFSVLRGWVTVLRRRVVHLQCICGNKQLQIELQEQTNRLEEEGKLLHAEYDAASLGGVSDLSASPGRGGGGADDVGALRRLVARLRERVVDLEADDCIKQSKIDAQQAEIDMLRTKVKQTMRASSHERHR